MVANICYAKVSVRFAGTKYEVAVTRTAPQNFRLQLGSTHVDVVGRKLNDGGILIQVRNLLIQKPFHIRTWERNPPNSNFLPQAIGDLARPEFAALVSFLTYE